VQESGLYLYTEQELEQGVVDQEEDLKVTTDSGDDIDVQFDYDLNKDLESEFDEDLDSEFDEEVDGDAEEGDCNMD
jgi:hypothetical protein